MSVFLYRNTINAFDNAAYDTQDISALREVIGTSSRTSGRRGVAKGEKSKPAKVWPEMGSLEWMVIKQVREGGIPLRFREGRGENPPRVREGRESSF